MFNLSICHGLLAGDVVLFRRDFLMMKPWGALICVVQQLIFNQAYDHCGVIVQGKDGIPYLLETTFSGTKLRPYEARIAHSCASEIVIRPLKFKRTLPNHELVRQYGMLKASTPRSWDIRELLSPQFPAAGAVVITLFISYSHTALQILCVRCTSSCLFCLRKAPQTVDLT
jgi:hypothetical protein